MRWSWRRAGFGALAAFGLALAGGVVVGIVEARRYTFPASRFAAGISTAANCAALYTIVGVPIAAAIAGLSGRRQKP